MTRDQLEAFALRLKAEMDREREERNYFQLERDKIRTFWEITRQQLGKCAARWAAAAYIKTVNTYIRTLRTHRGVQIRAAAKG